jgi:hypothetical protein
MAWKLSYKMPTRIYCYSDKNGAEACEHIQLTAGGECLKATAILHDKAGPDHQAL